MYTKIYHTILKDINGMDGDSDFVRYQKVLNDFLHRWYFLRQFNI